MAPACAWLVNPVPFRHNRNSPRTLTHGASDSTFHARSAHSSSASPSPKRPWFHEIGRRFVEAAVRGYTNDIGAPDYLWSEAGGAFRTLAGDFEAISPIDLLLEEPNYTDGIIPAEYDLVTGRLNPRSLGPLNRPVFIRAVPNGGRNTDESHAVTSPGEFRP